MDQSGDKQQVLRELGYVKDFKAKNDEINLRADVDVKLTFLKGKNDAELRVKLSGMSVDNSISNSLRRAVMQYVPVYGFTRSNIVINSSKSYNMYTNDMIYNQIESLPIFDIPNNFDLEDPNVYLSKNKIMVKLFGHYAQQKMTHAQIVDAESVLEDGKELLDIELVVNHKNNTDSDYFVSTHTAILKINGVLSDSYMTRDPIEFMVLKPGEEIYLKAKANIGMDILNSSYEACTHAFHRKIDDMTYHLWYESFGQLENKTILKKACQIIVRKLEFFKIYMQEEYGEASIGNKIEINLYGENHTIGLLIATALQKCKYTAKAGYSVPHPLRDSIRIVYSMADGSKRDPIKVLIKCVDYIIRVYNSIMEQINE